MSAAGSAASPRRRAVSPWLAASAVIALAIVAPLVAIAVTAATGSGDHWAHLARYVLPVAVRDTALLLAGVALVTAVVGTGTAWLVAAYEFPGRRLLDWALLLPLAVPTYIVAYAYLDLLHPVGPVQSALRTLLGIEDPRALRLPEVRSMTGCILLLGLVLYPYVYLTSRALFLMQTANVVDVARTLGLGRRAVFLRVALPLARPAIVIGVSLALLETLNDIGAAEFLGVRTLTVSIYTTWITRSDLPGAAQIALAMLAVVLAVLLLERWARRERRYADAAQQPRPLRREALRGGSAALALTICTLPVLLGFVVPTSYLVDAAIERLQFAGFSSAVLRETWNTIVLSTVATALTLGAGLLVAYTPRRVLGVLAPSLLRVATLGYAVPGTVLAIGLLPVVTGIEAGVDSLAARAFGVTTGLFLLGSGAAVIYAYFARFLTIMAGTVEAGLSRVPLTLDAAARTLGVGGAASLRRLHLPLLRPALATGALLVFVDCMKELPATLLLRPLGFETLATHLYGEAVRGTYEDAALAALLIVAVGLVPVLLLVRLARSEATAGVAPALAAPPATEPGPSL